MHDKIFTNKIARGTSAHYNKSFISWESDRVSDLDWKINYSFHPLPPSSTVSFSSSCPVCLTKGADSMSVSGHRWSWWKLFALTSFSCASFPSEVVSGSPTSCSVQLRREEYGASPFCVWVLLSPSVGSRALFPSPSLVVFAKKMMLGREGLDSFREDTLEKRVLFSLKLAKRRLISLWTWRYKHNTFRLLSYTIFGQKWNDIYWISSATLFLLLFNEIQNASSNKKDK